MLKYKTELKKELKNLRVAVCLYGNVGGKSASFGKGGWLDPKTSLKNYKKYIGKQNEVDFFVHSWSEQFSQDVIEVCKPKSFLFEKQIDFSNFDKLRYAYESYEGVIDQLQLDKGISRTEANQINFENTAASHSRFYSAFQSVTLMSKYAIEQGITYDFVIQIRMDLIFSKELKYMALNPNVFYFPARSSTHSIRAIDDYYFIANQANTEKFAGIYQHIYNYSSRPTVAALEHLEVNKIEYASFGKIFNNFTLIRYELAILEHNFFYRSIRYIYKKITRKPVLDLIKIKE